MKVRWICISTAIAIAVLGLGYFGALAGKTGVAFADEAQAALPLKVDNFRLTDQNLHSHELRLMSDDKAIVLITQQNGCPVNRNTGSSIKALQDQYAGKGVEFMMLNSTPSDSREDIVTEAKNYGYDLPILMDRNQLVGEQLGVTRTAEAIVIDPKTWKITYRGPIDDRVTYERQKAKADHAWVKDALDAMLAGLPVADAREDPVGCLIDFPNRDKLKASKISYTTTIAPIIQDKCVSCHQPGGIGPMALTSYEKIRAFSPMIREVIRTQRMPPWRADPTIGHFLDDKSLSPDQIKDLVHWVEAGSPRGDGPDPLATINFHAPEWPLGKPDLVLDIPAFTVPANGVVEYQHPFVLNPLTEGKWLRASTIKVENRQAVHHILTGYMSEAPKPGEQASEDKWGVSVGGYAVGSESIVEPADTGSYLPPGGAIGFQDHYTPFGKQVVEHSRIGLYFYDKKPKLVMHGTAILNPDISIPPNVQNHQENAYLTFPHDGLLYGAFPHAHYRGSSSQLWIRYPDGKEKLLLALPKYDFNWQRYYDFTDPIPVPAGSKLIAIYTYDNSTRNPANPDPNRMVPWGEQSSDEMLYTALRYRWVGETSDKPVDYDQALNATRLFGILDKNMDGKIEISELTGRMGARIKASFARIDTNHDGLIERDELAAAQAFMSRPRRPVLASVAPTNAAKTTVQ